MTTCGGTHSCCCSPRWRLHRFVIREEVFYHGFLITRLEALFGGCAEPRGSHRSGHCEFCGLRFSPLSMGSHGDRANDIIGAALAISFYPTDATCRLWFWLTLAWILSCSSRFFWHPYPPIKEDCIASQSCAGRRPLGHDRAGDLREVTGQHDRSTNVGGLVRQQSPTCMANISICWISICWTSPLMRAILDGSRWQGRQTPTALSSRDFANSFRPKG